MPQLRGAVKTGWIVLATKYDPNDMSSSIPRPAGVQVRNAQGGNPMDPPTRTLVTTADAEEREVGNVRNHARGVQDRNTNYRTTQGRRVNGSAEAQEGVEVRRLTTPTKWETNLERTSPGEAISQANSVRVQPGEGRSREDVMANMSEEEREEYLSRIEAHRNSYATEEDPQALRERQANQAVLDRRVVGRVAAPQTTQKEGFTVNNSVGGGTEIADVSGMGGPVAESVTESEGMTFRNTNVGKPKPSARPIVPAASASDMDTRRKIARSICPDFPDNYVFDDPIRKKIARLQADFDDRPDVIRAVAAADTDLEVRQRLVEEFPGAFE